MIRHPLRIVLTAFALYTFLPFLAGIDYHGSIVEALGIAAGVTLVCSVLYWALDALEGAYTGRLAQARTSELTKLAVLVISWLVTYILMPGLVLKLASSLLPAGMLGVNGIGSILLGGLVLFIIGAFTGAYVKRPETCNSCMEKHEEKKDDGAKKP